MRKIVKEVITINEDMQMQVRDKLNTLENYQKCMDFNKEALIDWKNDLANLYKAEAEGVQLYGRPNVEAIECVLRTIHMYQEDVMYATYSAGYGIETFLLEYAKTLEAMQNAWKHRGGYISMLDMLSIAMMLDLREAQCALHTMFNDPKRKDGFEIKDYLFDFLFQQCGFEVQGYADFMIKRPYANLHTVHELVQSDKAKALKKLKAYLERSWFSALKRQDLLQETHTSPHGTHCGYWSFESGVFVKLLGLDDSQLKDQPYYPYDLVHYKGL